MEDKIASLRSFVYQSRSQCYSRIGHRAIQLGHHILVFGGVTAQNDFNLPLLRINCQNIQTDIIPTKNTLKIQGFSLFSFKNHIYIWGGSGPDIYYNTLWCFTGEQFQVANQIGSVPSARHFHASYFFSQRYLLVYGGMNKTQIFNDWHIFDCQFMIWHTLKPNCQIPVSLDCHIVWNGGRGFLLTGQSFNAKQKKIIYQNKIYEFKFTNFHQYKIGIEPVVVTKNARLTNYRGSPSAILLNIETPYLLMLGGQRLGDKDKLSFYNDIWIFNLQTLQWTSGKLGLTVGFGYQTVLFQQRLYLIGGVNAGNRQLSNIIQIIQINADSIQAKVCQSCRQIYGLKEEYSGIHKQFTIKYEYQQNPKTFFSGSVVAKFTKFIRNPFSAIGLLVDNSFNLSGTCLNIELMQFGTKPKIQKDIAMSQIADSGLVIPYDYIKITDNSFGFTHDQILQCMFSFSIKTQQLTSDKKYEQQLQIRKQYGINLKLGALRLGKSCLFVTKTQDNYLFVCYFTCLQIPGNPEFRINYYFRTPQHQITSMVNYGIIKQNLKYIIPHNFQELPNHMNTVIYIFHLEEDMYMKKQIADVDSFRIQYSHSQSLFFSDLKLYLQSIYLSPFIGRVITLQNQPLKYNKFTTIFKKDESDSKIQKLDTSQVQSFFTHIQIYQQKSGLYQMKQILVYQQNRLIYSIETGKSGILGIIQIPAAIKVDICKTKIQNYIQQTQLINFVKHLIINGKQKKRNYNTFQNSP